jgi:outer membrane protein OmpU
MAVTNRITINIDGTAETDSGVEFFGRVRIRGGNTGDATAPAASGVSAPRVGARIGGLTVATGNITGAIDSLPGLYSGSVGLTGLSYSNVMVGGYDGFSSAGGGTNGVEVIYSANGLGVHLSHSSLTAGDRTALGLSYAFGDWNVALGHQSADLAAEDFTVLSATGAISSVSVGVQIADVAAGTAWRLSGGFAVGAGTNVTVFVADTDGATDTAYGLGFTHSLGGATLAGGVVSTNTGLTKADLGVRFEF